MSERHTDEPEVKLTERGWPGHFVLADRCLFRRNTLVEVGDERVVVSTVGRMRTRDGESDDTVGAFGRSFETMAFRAVMANGYWEADIGREFGLADQKRSISGFEPSRSGEASDMHDDCVAAVVVRLATRT